MTEDETFEAVMSGLRTGRSVAADAILVRFTRRMIALARRQLESTTRAKTEIEDVVQSVYKSFFARYGRGECDFNDWNELWALLAVITLRKCANRRKYHGARRRDPRREVALRRRAEGGLEGWEPVDREPTPLEAAMLSDTVQELFRGMGDHDHAAVSLLLQGYTAEEIARAMECSERTVRRVRARLKERLKQLYEA